MFMGVEKKPKKREIKVPFPKGSKYYLLRKKDGRDKIFPTPESLWKACCEYFEWVENNPLKEERAFSTKVGIRKVKINKKRAMTLAGLRVHLGISETGYQGYQKRDEYKWVTNAVRDIMYSQKFEGAAAGMLNGNIIARELGLADKQEFSGGVSVTKKNFNDFYIDDKKQG